MILQYISFKMILFTRGISCLTQPPCVPLSGEGKTTLGVKISYLCTYDFFYTTPYVMCLICEDPLRGQAGGVWALEIETFWGPVK